MRRIMRIIEAIHFEIFVFRIGYELRRDLAKADRLIADDKRKRIIE